MTGRDPLLARRIRNLALLLAAIAVALYLGFILLGVLRA